MKDKEKQLAIELRSLGMSLPDIAIRVGISKSTASLWLRTVPVPNQFKRRRNSVGRGVRIVIKVGPEPKRKERVRNGPYLVVVPPDGYPGPIYRGRYAYEHHVVYWKVYGVVPGRGQIIHHENENKHDNRIENLKLMTHSEHSRHHQKMRLVPG